MRLRWLRPEHEFISYTGNGTRNKENVSNTWFIELCANHTISTEWVAIQHCMQRLPNFHQVFGRFSGLVSFAVALLLAALHRNVCDGIRTVINLVRNMKSTKNESLWIDVFCCVCRLRLASQTGFRWTISSGSDFSVLLPVVHFFFSTFRWDRYRVYHTRA